MLVEFPFFGAGINYFPKEISALKVFEPRYLLLIADCIIENKSFIVGRSLEKIDHVVSEVKIIDYQDISNAEQFLIVECINIFKIKFINQNFSYPICGVEEYYQVGLPPEIHQLEELELNIFKMINNLIDKGFNIELPIFEVKNENRIDKLWELCRKTPVNIEIKDILISENDLMERYNFLSKYVNNILNI